MEEGELTKKNTSLVLLLLLALVAMFTLQIHMANANGDDNGNPNDLIGDINHDGRVNMEDLSLACLSFFSYPGHSRWNPEADLDNNDLIDLRDIGIVAINFGATH